MPEGNSKKPRKRKESAGVNGGGGKTRLTIIEKVLINGPRGFGGLGSAHRTRKTFDRSKTD